MFAKVCISMSLVAAEDPSVTMFLADSGHAASMWQDEKDFESGLRKVMQLQTADLEKMVEGPKHSSLMQADPSVTMFLADSGHAASMWQDEHDFESDLRKVMELQTADLEKIVEAQKEHPKSLLLQTEIATRKVEDLSAKIHAADDATKVLSEQNSDAAPLGAMLNACNYARAGALEAYEMVDKVVNGFGAVVGGTCICVAGMCPGQAIPYTCGYPKSGYGALQSQADALWEQVKATTLRCKIIGDPQVLSSLR